MSLTQLKQLARMSNWTVRTKLGVLMVPLAFAVAGLAGVQIVVQEASHSELVSAQHALEVGTRAWEVADALQGERSAVVSFIHSGRRDNASFVEAVQRVDTAVAAMRVAVGRAEQLAPAVRSSADKALTELGGLDALRRVVQQTRYPGVSAHTRYSQILEVLVWTGRATADSVSTLPVGSDVAAIQSLGAAQEHMATQNAILLAAAYARDLPPQQATQLRAAQSRFDAAVAEFNAAADSELRQRYQDTVSGAEVDDHNRLIQLALVQSGANRPVTVAAADAARTGEAATKRITTVRGHVTADAVAMTDALTASARRSTVAVSAMIVAVLLIALAVAALVANSILRPLRVLRRTALRVAKYDLPDAISRILADPHPLAAAKTAIAKVPIDSEEEIGQVARAFDDVNAAAVHQAARQALLRDDMTTILVDLGRRSQSLVERQIHVIDKLELDEQDPDQLAELFKLDHLATRMRRNSENILVLSGSELSRRPVHPMPLHEVFGTAVSEAEQFARVTQDVSCDVAVRGHVVKDLAHLLAELLDNATGFSQPTTKVTLRGALLRTHDLVIEVSDQGIGMPQDQIDETNRELTDAPDFGGRVAGHMGLRVVARLARRHGITVSLRANSHGDGVTAKVLVPADLLAAAPPPAHPIPAAAAGTPPDPVVIDAPVDLFQPRGEVEPATPADELATTLPTGAVPPARKAPATHRRDELPRVHAGGASAPCGGDEPAAQREPTTDRLPPFDPVMSQWFRPTHTTGTDTDQTTVTAALSEAGATTHLEGSVPLRPSLALRAAGGWTSPADERWRVASAIATPARPAPGKPDELPKRTPKAFVVPGWPDAPEPEPPSGIDADRTRQRLAAFQRGVRQGREEPVTPADDMPETDVTNR